MTHRDRAGDPPGRRKAAGDAGHRQGFPTPSGGSPARPERRFPKAFGQERVARRCGTSEAMRDAVRPRARKSWEAATPVARANRRRASESLDDIPHRLRLPSYPADRPHDLYGSLSARFGITRPAPPPLPA